MDEKKIQQILIEIVHSVLNEVEDNASLKQKLTPDILPSVCALAKKYDLAHIVSDFVYRNGIEAESKLLETLQREEIMSVYRCEQMKHAQEEICGIFDEARIPHIPLKGAVLRSYYPYESMRTSCDIDILVRESDLEGAIKCLEGKGYRCGERRYHDVSLYSPNNVHLELHFNIQENEDHLDAVLKDVWQYATLVSGSRYELTKEFFVFYTYAHMEHHFLWGGCGLRAFIDIWVMEHKMDASYSCAEELLKKADIYDFAVEMSRISNKCFTEGTQDSFAELVLKYICDGGLYGSMENHIAVYRSRKNNFLCYLAERLFAPYRHMVIRYPILKKAPILLPIYWIARCAETIFKRKTKRISSEISFVNGVSSAKVEEAKEIRMRMGLK